MNQTPAEKEELFNHWRNLRYKKLYGDDVDIPVKRNYLKNLTEEEKKARIALRAKTKRANTVLTEEQLRRRRDHGKSAYHRWVERRTPEEYQLYLERHRVASRRRKLEKDQNGID